jgi:hypothetical protein
MTARIPRAAAVALTLAGLALSGCSSGNPPLERLESDPLVTTTVAGDTEAQLFGQIEFSSLGKHRPAMLTRLLQTGDTNVTDAELQAVGEQARAAGWRMTPADNGTWVGTKTIDGRRVELSIQRRASSRLGGRLIAIVMTYAP